MDIKDHNLFYFRFLVFDFKEIYNREIEQLWEVAGIPFQRSKEKQDARKFKNFPNFDNICRINIVQIPI